MKRLARYLLLVPDVVIYYTSDFDESELLISIFVDSDWAGCKTSRKSTSGGVLTLGGCVVKSWSSTQGSIALSVAEAEYYAAVKGAAEALGFQSMFRDLGFDFRIELWQDSSAAKSIASRAGIGKIRHLDVRWLWLQRAVKDKLLTCKKILGEENPADILTKPKNLAEIIRLGSKVGFDLIVSSTPEHWDEHD